MRCLASGSASHRLPTKLYRRPKSLPPATAAALLAGAPDCACLAPCAACRPLGPATSCFCAQESALDTVLACRCRPTKHGGRNCPLLDTFIDRRTAAHRLLNCSGSKRDHITVMITDCPLAPSSATWELGEKLVTSIAQWSEPSTLADTGAAPSWHNRHRRRCSRRTTGGTAKDPRATSSPTSSPPGNTFSPVECAEFSAHVPPLLRSPVLPSPACASAVSLCLALVPRRGRGSGTFLAISGPLRPPPSALAGLLGWSLCAVRPRSVSARHRAAARVVACMRGDRPPLDAGQSAHSLSSAPEPEQPAPRRPGRLPRSPRARRLPLPSVGYGRAARFFGRGGGTASWLPAFSSFRKYFCAWLRTW